MSSASSTTTTTTINDPEQVLSTIDAQYFDSSQPFDNVRFFLEQDNEELSDDYLDAQFLKHDKALKYINNQLAKTVMENYTSFVQGMTKVQEVGMDLTNTSILCRSGRRRLHQAQEDVVKGGLSVLAKYRQRKAFLNLIYYLTKIKDIMEKEKELFQLMEEGDFPAAIQLMLRHRAAIASCRHFHAVRQLENNIQKGYRTLTTKVAESLNVVLGSFNGVDYERILIAYKLLEMPADELTKKIDAYYVGTVDGLLVEVARSFVMRNQKAKIGVEELLKMKKFGELCKYVSSDDLLPCLLQALSVLSDLMLNYYAIYSWHMMQERASYSGGGNGTPDDAAQYDFSSIRQFVEDFRTTLWFRIQNKFSVFLNNADFAHFKIDKFLQVFHALNMLCELGEEFSETDSHQLRGALRAKTQMYFLNFHKDTLENLRSMMDNEGWQRLDSSCFSLRDVPQFDQSYSYRRNTSSDRIDQFIKQVRMFLHSNDSEQNPFKTAAEKGSFLLEEQETEDGDSHQQRYQSDSDDDDHSGGDESDDEVEEQRTSSQQAQMKKQIEKRKQGPVFTNISMSILKRMGTYVHAMEVLQLVGLDIFFAFASLFKFYAYTVHSMFGDIMDNPQSDILLPENDSAIPEELRDAFREFRQMLNNYNGEKFFPLARPSQLLLAQLRSPKSQYGFYERSVAAESLTYMKDAISTVCKQRLSHLVPKSKAHHVEKFTQQMKTVVSNIQSTIYEREARALFGRKYDDKIDKKWTPTQVSRESAYITSITRDLEEFKKIMNPLESHGGIPSNSTVILWTNVLKSIMENIVDGYSKVKLINHQGIAQMQLDLKMLTSALESTIPQNVRMSPPGTQRKEVPYVYLVRNYIEGFYNSSDYMVQWAQENKDNFTLSQALSIIQLGPEMQNLKRKERNDLTEKIQDIYRVSGGSTGAVAAFANVFTNLADNVPSPIKPQNNLFDRKQDSAPPQPTSLPPPPPSNPATSVTGDMKQKTSMWNRGIGFLKRDNQETGVGSTPPVESASRVSIDGNRPHMEEGGMKKSNSLWNNLHIGGGENKLKVTNFDMGKFNMFKRRDDDPSNK